MKIITSVRGVAEEDDACKSERPSEPGKYLVDNVGVNWNLISSQALVQAEQDDAQQKQGNEPEHHVCNLKYIKVNIYADSTSVFPQR